MKKIEFIFFAYSIPEYTKVYTKTEKLGEYGSSAPFVASSRGPRGTDPDRPDQFLNSQDYT